MKTPYDVLGVPRNASGDRIRTAFCKAAKAYHPDLNAGNPRTEPQLRLVIAAYEILKNPQKRMAYDRYLRDCRRERFRQFAMSTAASLLSGGIVALAVWLSVLPSMTQEASAPPQTTRVAAVDRDASERVAAAHDSLHQDVNGSRKSDRVVAPDGQPHRQQFASIVPPAAGHAEPQVPLPRERPQIRGSDDPTTSRAVATRNPGVTKSELARADDMFSHALRLGADDAIAARAQQRPVRSGAQAFAEEDRVMSRAPSSSGSPARRSLEERAAGFVHHRLPAGHPPTLATLAQSQMSMPRRFSTTEATSPERRFSSTSAAISSGGPSRSMTFSAAQSRFSVSRMRARLADWWAGKRATIAVQHPQAEFHSLNIRSRFHVTRSKSSAKAVQS